jgi:hypothetical protein
MSDVFRTLIVPDAYAPLARSIAAALSESGRDMWTTPLAPTADGPPTHWVSSGWIPPGWQYMVPCQTWQVIDGVWTMTDSAPGHPEAVVAACAEAGLSVDLADVLALFASADVTAQNPWMAFDRLGLVMVAPADSEELSDE